jgi:hypothetical protein
MTLPRSWRERGRNEGCGECGGMWNGGNVRNVEVKRIWRCGDVAVL